MCPWHCNIVYNDISDEEAKRSAEQLSQLSSQEDSIRQLSCSTINRIIKNEQINDWQLSWQRSTTGSAIPNVKTKIKWSCIRSIDMSYARILLGSTNLKAIGGGQGQKNDVKLI